MLNQHLNQSVHPPFIIKFSSGNVGVNQVKTSIINHCKSMYNQDINVLNCRLATKNSSASHNTNINSSYDILLYLKDVLSFAFLLEDSHWPSMFNNASFSIPVFPSVPLQLSLLIKNVDLKVEAAPGFSGMLNLSYEAWDPHKTDIAIIWDMNDECS